MSSLELLQRRLEREQTARKSAESLLEAKSRELYLANEELRRLAAGLERHVEERTAALLVACQAAEAASVAKSQFLANMSHEMRTPLNCILGFTELLLGDAHPDPDEARDFLQSIESSGWHLLSLINDILDLSKIEAGKLDVEIAPCSPYTIIAEVVSVLRVRARERGLTLEYRWTTDVPATILSDGGRIRQLLINLVGNAIKFTETGGVTIEAAVDAASEPALLRFRVIDTGIGIPADMHNAIFEPFVQADASLTRRFGGTGLGLAISRRIVAALGGTLSVESTVGQGSVFTATIAIEALSGVSLAAADSSDLMRGPAVPSETALPNLAGLRVLVVDDGETNRKLLNIVLRRAGAEVALSENGQAALDIVANRTFDVILMDMQMPVLDGYAAARRLRERGLDVPIIALTAHAMRGDQEKCRAAGCSGYLSKPIDTLLLLRQLSMHVPAVPVASGDRVAPPDPHAPIRSTLPMGDAEYRELVGEFVGALPAMLDRLQRAFRAGDLENLAHRAHRLKGTGGSVGFACLTTSAQKLELAAKDRDLRTVARQLDELTELVQRIVLD